jgi:ATP-dependent helicase/nuclease subunit A
MSQATPQQQAAIDATGAVLLAAGAGTGKTATLVQRCLRLVLTQGVDVDRLLVVTFTNAAAAEMKQRLRDALNTGAAAQPEDERLQRQWLLLEGAHISTIHAFCLDLVRAHFAELGVDPAVSVLEESVTGPLARTTALDVVREAIGAGPDTQALAEQYCWGSGEALGELVRQTHQFLVAQPQAETLLDRLLGHFAGPDPEDWRQHRRAIVAAWVIDAAQSLPAEIQLAIATLQANRLYGGGSPTAKAMQRLAALLPALARRFDAVRSGTGPAAAADLLREAAALAGPETWVRGTGSARAPLDRFFQAAVRLEAWQAAGGADPLDADWALVRGPMRRLLELVRDFDTAFAAAKRALGGLDFPDLERFALRLLRDADGRPTRIAREWRERLDHVFVDECQDINAAQDALIRALSREDADANLFMVGDVKQSIYRFRLAAPELFRQHANDWAVRAHHQVLPLTENFRSREGILAFANDLFGFLWSTGLGGIRYGPLEQLAFALPARRRPLSLDPGPGQGPAGAWADPDCRVELHLVRDDRKGEPADTDADAGDGGGWGDLLGLERQAQVAATRLRELMDGGHEVWDKTDARFRPLQWRDVGLLLRSVRGRSAPFLRQFRVSGIPLAVEQGDFLDTVEASDLAAILRVLDNPQQDIPMFAALRSPLVGWTLDELAGLPATGRGSRALDRIEAAGRRATPHAAKAIEFSTNLARWRRLALMTSLTAVLETVLAETRYTAYLLTLPDGTDRVANVRRFLDLAQRYDPLQRQGLSRFLRFIDEQRAAGRPIEPLPPRQASAVQLLSVHKSKGLEFPVVVLAGLDAPFHQPESHQPVLLSRAWGVAPQVVNLPARRRGDSLVLWQAKREERLAALAEELRLLYVAVTRTRDTLLLVGSFKPESKAWNERMDLPAALAIPKATCPCDWLALWLGNRADWNLGSGEVSFPSAAPTARLRWRVHSGPGTVRDSASPASQTSALEPDGTSRPAAAPPDTAPPVRPFPAGSLDGLANAPGAPEPSSLTRPAGTLSLRRERAGDEGDGVQSASPFGWRYAHETATRTPAKTSASALRRLAAQADPEAAAPWPLRRVFANPRASGVAIEATAVGTAHHVFLEHLDLAHADTAAGLVAEVERLRAAQLLQPDEAAALDLASILDFWIGPLGTDIRRNRDRVRRELAFTAAFAPGELAAFAAAFAGVAGDEFVVVQGSVDLAVLRPEGIWVVDFKTDQVAVADLPERAREHARQLRLYAAALHRVYGRPVTRCLLHFLARRRSWDVNCTS